MSLKIKHDEKNQQFTAYLQEEEIGELTYALPNPETIDFQHTFIKENYRGKGHANNLIQHGLDYAAQQNLTVKATCQAVAKYMERQKG